MAIVINGSGEISGISVGGLPDDIVDAGTLADNAVGLAQMASGTDGNIITYDTSGNPAVVATGSDGQVLTSAGADAVPAFEAAAGITTADEWILTSPFTGDATITSNLSRIESLTADVMTESSGVFTFPSTGCWLILANWIIKNNTDTAEEKGGAHYISFTIDDGSNWTHVNAPITMLSFGTNSYTTSMSLRVVDVTDVSNDKIRFSADVSHADTVTIGGADPGGSACKFLFLRLGDT